MSSVSWMAEKTSTELIPMLKNAYNALKDKEKDLVLAAELGKSLLEHNLQLKTKYDSLLNTVTPPITPSSSTVPIQEKQVNIDNFNTDLEDEENTIRFIPSRGTREAMIEVLERKNMELTAKLEQAINEQDSQSRLSLKKTRQLENEISLLKSDLHIATVKIQELQEMNERQKMIEATMNHVVSKRNKDEERLIDELYIEINKMKQERNNIIQSKKELEVKLAASLKDLGELKAQFEKIEFTQQDFDRLKEAYERQFTHIDELNHSIEEHRAILQKLKDKGIYLYSAFSTPTSSSYNDQNYTNEIHDPLQSTLLSELKTLDWLNHRSSPYVSKTSPESSSMLFNILEFKEKSLAAIYNAPSIDFESVLSRATGIDKDILDDTISFIDKIERQHYKEKAMVLRSHYEDDDVERYDFSCFDDQYPSSDLYPQTSDIERIQFKPVTIDKPKTFVERLRNYIKQLFDIIWKWCRFTMVLSIALLINAWQGPEILYAKS
ncbi:uncharacterized protein BX663DRAFT_531608 [Cokeromyces recurvatus]|uniref:uncharacterized protein n=1 Tax=Cokeromyces recurvatus TaxID=90255 RepID=UPI002220EFA4|nr:uncharacterized protein BX663DRAFT_531608 [Cokeromyces recurvatus]KAI7901865.1 hypothetical protein BX663DRAFT_531608 [Cokeromyces recurvatus]